MTRPPVVLERASRVTVMELVLRKACLIGVDIRAMAVGATHVHLLGNFREDGVEAQVGMLKRNASHRLRQTFPGGIWSERCHHRRVRQETHFHETIRYILGHEQEENAAVWSPSRGSV